MSIKKSFWYNEVVMYSCRTSNFEDIHVRKLEFNGARKEAEARTWPVEVPPDARAARILPALHELNYCLEKRNFTSSKKITACYTYNMERVLVRVYIDIS